MKGSIHRPGLSLLLSICAIVMVLTGCKSSQQTSGSSNFIAPGYIRKDYKKILVLALIKPESYKKKIENAIVTDLKDRRYPVKAAHEDFPPNIYEDSLALRKRVLESGYDAAVVISYLGGTEAVTEHAQFNGNVYSLFYGYYAVFDMDTKTVGNAFFQCDFFVADKLGTQWRAPVRVNTSNDVDLLLQMIARNVRLQLVGDKII